jgi:RNA polymerase subunit RPABC4/transcription elongation factor Spt4
MSEQSELSCVSCETTFDPTPNGGFCPNCDTPHPDFGHDEEMDEDEGVDEHESTADEEPARTEEAEQPAVDAPSYCPDCGFDLTGDLGADPETVDSDIRACPDCGRSVTDESFCPDCGTDLDALRESTSDDSEAVEAEPAGGDEPDESEPASVPDAVTLVVNGDGYSFEDGETFGRRDDGWLQDLVEASGGSDEVSYVSSEHLEFSFEDDGVFVVDVSRNGTSLNGTALDGGKAKISDGDTLTLAERAEIDIEL